MENKSATLYQFVVLLAIIGMNTYILVTTSQVNEMLTGALIGVMIGIGTNAKK